MGNTVCECGCGEEIVPARHHKYSGTPRFKAGGHWTRWNAQHGTGATTPKRVPDPIPSGICECGCGGATAIAKQTNYTSGSVKGYPNRFIKNHHPKSRHRGERAAAWKGGRWQHKKSGYWKVLVTGHPAADKDGYVFEHRIVMEGHLQRYLRREETVHHRNGNTSDNRPENLELWAKKHSHGQRVEDLLAWAKEIVATYGDEEGLLRR